MGQLKTRLLATIDTQADKLQGLANNTRRTPGVTAQSILNKNELASIEQVIGANQDAGDEQEGAGGPVVKLEERRVDVRLGSAVPDLETRVIW